MSNIKLKNLLNEQWSPDAAQKQLMQVTGDTVKKSNKQNADILVAKKIAKKIYDAKGYVWDEEYGVVQTIKSIADSNQYNQVTVELQKLTGGKGIAQYVTSFIDVDKAGKDRWHRAKLTIYYLDIIIKHLKSIKASENSLKIFNDYLTKYKKTYPTEPTQSAPGELDWSKMDFSGTGMGVAANAMEDPEFRHTYLQVMGFATAFIPVVGWGVSAGILALDAADQYSQGNMREAGLSSLFALMPVVGKGLNLIAKMPGVARLGEKGMATLGRKLALSGDPVLSAVERVAIKDVWKYNYALKNGIDNYVKASLANQVTNSIVRDRIRQQLGQRGANIMFKIADGGIKTSVLVTKLAIPPVAFDASVEQYHTLFDKLYANPKAKKNIEKAKQYRKQNPPNPDDMFNNLEPMNPQNKKKK